MGHADYLDGAGGHHRRLHPRPPRFDRLRDRFGYVGGAEYIVIGFLLGHRVTGLLGAGQVQDLTPIVSLALGWDHPPLSLLREALASRPEGG